MSRSAAASLFAAAPAGFAHRGLHGPDCPENSLAAFRRAADSGAGIECDVRLSSDGHPMIFHDARLGRMCGVSAEAEALPAAWLMRLPLGGTAERVPWLGQLLEVAGKRTALLLELKVQQGRASAHVGLLCRSVAQLVGSHAGPVGVMSFDPRVGAWFSAYAPDVPRGLVIAHGLSRWKRMVALALARPHFLAVETSAARAAWVRRQRRRRPIAVWTVRTREEREALAPWVDALIWEDDGRP